MSNATHSGRILCVANITTYLADKLLDHSLGTASFTMPTPWLALFTTNPTMPAGTGGVEVTLGSYLRVNISGDLAGAVSGQKTSNATINFATASAAWGTIVGVGIFDASTAGNLLWAGPLSANQTVGIGDPFQIPVGDLVVALG